MGFSLKEIKLIQELWFLKEIKISMEMTQY